MSSYVTTEIGLNENNREPGCFPRQQQQQQQQLHRKCPNNNNNDNDNDNELDNNRSNDAEEMIAENSKPSSAINGTQLDSTDATSSSATATSNASTATSSASTATSSVKATNGAIQNRSNKADGEFLEAESLAHRCSRDGQRRDNNDARKCKLSIKHETVIVSRIDRIPDAASGQRTSSLYKCHLCGKLGTSLEKVRRHLVTHSRRLPFRCSACDARFQLRPHLSFHVKNEHRQELDPDVRTPAVNPVTAQSQSPDSCVNGSMESSDLSDKSGSGSLAGNSVIILAREPPVNTSLSASLPDSGVIRTRAEVSTSYSYSNGPGKYSVPISGAADSPKDYSSGTVASVRAAATSSLNQIYEDFSTLGGATDVHDNEVDSSMGMDMTCRPRSRQNGQGHGQGQGQGELQQNDRIGAEVEMALHNSTRSRGVGGGGGGGGGGGVAVDLATKIRETEHLSDDVTVVIPSDVPLTGNEAKRGDESESNTCRSKIIHAPPHKSILGNSHLRTKRKLSSSAPTAPQQSAEPPSKLPLPHHVKPHQTDNNYLAVLPGGASPSALPMSVYNPLALSGFVQGFGGLMSPSLLSPIIAQTPLGFPGMLVNPLSLYAAQLSSSSLASLMNAKAAGMSVTAASLREGGGGLPGGGGGGTQGKAQGCDAAGTRIKEELPCSSSSASSIACCSSTSDGYASPNSKCSSLSRTHSRLNVIQKPIKRENAYKPIVMSDGRTAYHCLYCNKNFCTISDVNRHMDFHEDIRPYKCRFCSYYARTNSQLKVHMMRHQGIRDFLCRLCNYKGVTQSDLNRHTKSQIHMMKERNVCALCREGFVSPMNLEQHRIEKHFKMENCGDSGVKYHLTMAGLVKENAAN